MPTLDLKTRLNLRNWKIIGGKSRVGSAIGHVLQQSIVYLIFSHVFIFFGRHLKCLFRAFLENSTKKATTRHINKKQF